MAHPPLGLSFWSVLRLLGPIERRGLAGALGLALAAERERWFLWLPVALAPGIGVYFALPREPWPHAAAAVLTLFLVLTLGARWTRLPRPLGLGLIALAAGFLAAEVRTRTVEAPVLARPGLYRVEGRVALVEEVERGARVTLDRPWLENVAAAATPVRIRFSVRNPPDELRPGNRVAARVRLMPPSAPAAPGDFDFARHAFFERLGAVGYAFGAAEVRARDGGSGWSEGLATLRQDVAAAIGRAVPGAAGAVGAALLTGLRGGIPDAVWSHMQASGLAHLLAISGLHLGLVAGTLFFAARIAIALCPPLALRVHGKKLAAAFALAGALGYLLITGQTVPTQRAFIMTALVLVAVMVDRNPFSMRLVALAALFVLLFRPEALLGPSFQMSFAAVVALIAAYETGAGPRRSTLDGLDRRLLLYVGGVFLTTVVASLATAPFAVHHFGRLPTYGVLANLIAVPLTAFYIMPLGLLGLLLMPLGLEGAAFAMMGHGISAVLGLAGWVASLPGAAVRLPPPPLAAVVVTTLGGLWLCIWQQPWRRFGLLGVPAGLLLWIAEAPPDVLIDARGRLAAVRLESGVALAPWGRDGWVHGMWLERFGEEVAVPWPEPGDASPDGALRCDHLGCVLTRAGQRIAFARRPEALLDDCAHADLVLGYPRLERCPGGGRLIGPDALWRSGGMALRIEPERIVIETVAEHRGERPWVAR